jgi:hypothetical protein
VTTDLRSRMLAAIVGKSSDFSVRHSDSEKAVLRGYGADSISKSGVMPESERNTNFANKTNDLTPVTPDFSK